MTRSRLLALTAALALVLTASPAVLAQDEAVEGSPPNGPDVCQAARELDEALDRIDGDSFDEIRERYEEARTEYEEFREIAQTEENSELFAQFEESMAAFGADLDAADGPLDLLGMIESGAGLAAAGDQLDDAVDLDCGDADAEDELDDEFDEAEEELDDEFDEAEEELEDELEEELED